MLSKKFLCIFKVKIYTFFFFFFPSWPLTFFRSHNQFFSNIYFFFYSSIHLSTNISCILNLLLFRTYQDLSRKSQIVTVPKELMQYSSIFFYILNLLLYSILFRPYCIHRRTHILHILKRKDISETQKGHFNIYPYLSVLIPGSYTSIQEYITLKSGLNNLFSNLKRGV